VEFETKLIIFVFTHRLLRDFLLPKCLLVIGFEDREKARASLEELQAFAAQDGVPWTLTHMLFANIGGFVYRSHFPNHGTIGPCSLSFFDDFSNEKGQSLDHTVRASVDDDECKFYDDLITPGCSSISRPQSADEVRFRP